MTWPKKTISKYHYLPVEISANRLPIKKTTTYDYLNQKLETERKAVCYQSSARTKQLGGCIDFLKSTPLTLTIEVKGIEKVF